MNGQINWSGMGDQAFIKLDLFLAQSVSFLGIEWHEAPSPQYTHHPIT